VRFALSTRAVRRDLPRGWGVGSVLRFAALQGGVIPKVEAAYGGVLTTVPGPVTETMNAQGQGVGLQLAAIKEACALHDGSSITAYRLRISGSFRLPADRCAVRVRVALLDVTDAEKDAQPLMCDLEACSGEGGVLYIDREELMDGREVTLSSHTVALLPIPAFRLPRRGARRVRIAVMLQGVEYFSDTVYGTADCVISMTQTGPGHVDIQAATRDGQEDIARLAVAVCAADGDIDAREMDVIHRFFKQRNPLEIDEEGLRGEVKDTLEDAVSEFYWAGGSQEDNIAAATERLAQRSDPVLSQVAYALCAAIVAADDEITEEERAALVQVAAALHLDDNLTREEERRARQRGAFQWEVAAAYTGMRGGLTLEAKRLFLREELSRQQAHQGDARPRVREEAIRRAAHIDELLAHISG